MNFFFYKNIVFFLLFWGINVACQALQAQNPKDMTYGIIDSLRILPDEPTVDDEISVVAYTSFGYTSCTMDSILKIGTYSDSDTALVVTVQHSFKDDTVTGECESIDTVLIGKMDEGVYSLTYNIYNSFFATNQKEIIFSVEKATDINPEFYSTEVIHVYPNPSQNFISLEFESAYDFDIQGIKLFDINGRNVLNKNFDINQSRVLINLSSLKTGLYNIIILYGNKKFLKRIIKL